MKSAKSATKANRSAATEGQRLPKGAVPIRSENERRFVRIDISSPIDLRTVKDIFGNFNPAETTYPIAGTILNISAGGVLVEIDQPVNEGDIVAMRILLDRLAPLEGVLGMVKRCDSCDDCQLAGIEFTSCDRLMDMLSQAEVELLAGCTGDFEHTVQEALEGYVAQNK